MPFWVVMFFAFAMLSKIAMDQNRNVEGAIAFTAAVVILVILMRRR